MKPQEILSMIEEAAGTSLYESKKQSALKTIEKKDNKLTDINKILDEELNPTLGKLYFIVCIFPYLLLSFALSLPQLCLIKSAGRPVF